MAGRIAGRYLVTGGAGFVGSHTVAALLDRGDEVVVLDSLSTGHRDAVLPGARLVVGDLDDAGLVDELLLYVAPVVLGDGARGMFALPDLDELRAARRFRMQDVKRVGADVRLVARAEV